jgi:hypothetical protein
LVAPQKQPLPFGSTTSGIIERELKRKKHSDNEETDPGKGSKKYGQQHEERVVARDIHQAGKISYRLE